MHSFYRELKQNNFFSMLPDDWRNEISITWNTYSNEASIYLLDFRQNTVAGGIVFSTCPPDMLYNKEEAQIWLDAGYLYLGFIWVAEEFRNNKFGSIWLQSLMDKFPAQKFWLTIEEESLLFFYFKNGFRLIKSLKNGDNMEWLLVFEPI